MSEKKPDVMMRKEVLKFAADPRFRKRIVDASMRNLVYGEETDTTKVILQTMVEMIEEERVEDQS